MTFFAKSLASKLTSITVIGAFIALTIALYGISNIRSDVVKYNELMAVDVESERTISAMNYAFKVQVQEWKNVLIRGSNPDQLTKYWGKFQKHEQEINGLIDKLDGLLTSDEAKQLVSEFAASYKQAMPKYKAGLEAFKQANFNHSARDKAVKGIDREPAKLLFEAQKLISEEVAIRSEALRSKAESDFITSISLLVVGLIFMVAGMIWGFKKGLIEPTAAVEKFLQKLAQGEMSAQCSLRSQDELGRIAGRARELQSYLIDVAKALSGTSKNIDQSYAKIS